MARPAHREPQTDQQRIDRLEGLLAERDREVSDLRKENDILRDLMGRYLTAEQIIDIVTKMEVLRRS